MRSLASRARSHCEQRLDPKLRQQRGALPFAGRELLGPARSPQPSAAGWPLEVDSRRMCPSANLAALDLNLLVALDALLHEESVTSAGRRIGVSQPAMSHAL